MRSWIGWIAVMAVTSPIDAGAQEVLGGLEGWVVDADERPLPGVEVAATAAGRPDPRHATTGPDGRFRLSALPLGVWNVELRLIGFRPVTFRDVRVLLGRTLSLGRVRLEPVAVDLPEILVAGQTVGVDVTTAATAVNLDANAFETLPLDRTFGSVVLLAPQANESFLGDGVNIAGSTGQENAVFIDGANVTDPYLGLTSVALPYNFVEQVQVLTSGYEPEFGRAQGGIINVATRSGTNDLSVEAFAYLRGSDMTAPSRVGIGETPVQDFSERDVGLSVSGPVVRDRLWFFAAYNPTFESRHTSVPGLGVLPDDRTRHRFAGKLDWRPRAATSLALTLAGDPNTYDKVGPLFLTTVPTAFADSAVVLGRVSEGGVTVALHARHQASARLVLETTLSRLELRADDEPRSAADAAELVVQDLETGVISGGYGGFTRDRARRTGVQASATFGAGPHLLKSGIEFEDNFADHTLALSPDAGGAGILSRNPDGTFHEFRVSSVGRSHNRILTAYVQDAWQATSRLLVSGGWRFEPQRFATDGGPSRRLTEVFVPRVGLVYQTGRLGTQKLFGSFGRFQEQIPVTLTVTADGQTLQWDTTYTEDPRGRRAPVFVVRQLAAAPAPETPHPQYYDEATLGYERMVGSGIRLGIRGIYRAIGEVIEDATDTAGVGVVGNPGRGRLVNLPRPRRTYTALELTLQRLSHDHLTFLASYVLSRDHGNYTGLFASDIEVAGANIGPQFDFPSQLENGEGLLPSDRTHVLKLSGAYRPGPGVSLGTTALLASGTPLSEYGSIEEFGLPYWGFVRQRGTAGRTPAIWDLGLRLTWAPRGDAARGAHPQFIVDLLHIGSPRHAVDVDQRHYTSIESGVQAGPSPTYGAVTRYQPPMGARVGLVVDF